MVGGLLVHHLVMRLARYLSTDGFTAVPGYSGGLHLKGPGHVELVARMDGTGRVVLRYRLWLESGGCTHDPPLEYKSTAACNLALSVAKSCSDPSLLGVHHWNHSRVEHDPWLSLRYVADMDDPSLRRMRTVRHLVVGLSFAEIYGHAVVLTDAEGVPAACGLLEREWTSVRFLNHHAVIILASIAAAGSLIFTAILSVRHCRLNMHRALRRYTVRILLMVPIFNMEALAALALHLSALNAEILKLIREVYEAIVIFSFLQFIIVCVGGPKRLVARFTPAEGASPREPLRPVFPWKYCLPPWRSAEQMLRCCILGTMSYVVVGIVVAVISFALKVVQVPDWFVEGWLKASRVLIGLAQFAAINSLVELAEKNMQELRPLKPLGKFLSVKLVVFFTFWQSLLIGHLVHKGIFVDFFDNQEKWGTQQAVGEGVLDVIVVLEMFVVSIFHFCIFPPRDYELLETDETEHFPPGWSRAKSTLAQQTLDIFSPGDVFATVCPACAQSMGWGTQERAQGVERTWFTSDGRRRTMILCDGGPLQRICADVSDETSDPTSSEDDEDDENEDDQVSGSASEEQPRTERRQVTFSPSSQSPCR